MSKQTRLDKLERTRRAGQSATYYAMPALDTLDKEYHDYDVFPEHDPDSKRRMTTADFKAWQAEQPDSVTIVQIVFSDENPKNTISLVSAGDKHLGTFTDYDAL